MSRCRAISRCSAYASAFTGNHFDQLDGTGAQLKPTSCAQCGTRYPPGSESCPACAAIRETTGLTADQGTEWARVRDSLKTRWVAAVLAFWVSTLVLGAVSLIGGRLDLVLLSICLGLLIVGLWLKSRYRLHLRRGPGGP